MISLLVSIAITAAPGAFRPEPPTGEIAHLEADDLSYDDQAQLAIATGHAVLSSERILIRADSLEYNQQTGRALAHGHVTFIAGSLIGFADDARVELDSDEAFFTGGRFFQKRGVDPGRLRTAKTEAELMSLGQSSAALSGTHVVRKTDDELVIDQLSFTPCDCDVTRPSWHVEAKSADVISGERAILWWPVIYVQKVPVFASPWLYLPLADRRSGLLFPRPNVTANNSFSLDVPLYLTLGRSFDLTLTPGYYVGAPRASILDANNNTLWIPRAFGIEGPRLSSEFRYAPAERTQGQVNLDLVYDTKPPRDPTDPSLGDFLGSGYTPYSLSTSQLTAKLAEHRGLRGGLTIQHAQDLGDGFSDRVDATFASDGYYPKDLQTDLLLRENQYLRSTAVLARRGDDSYSGLDVTLRQDLRWGFSFFGDDRGLDGSRLHGPNTFQRLPALRWALPERHMAGPLFFSVDAELTRLSPLTGVLGDEGATGPAAGIFDAQKYGPTALDPTQGNGQLDPGERQARDRLDLHPRLSAQLTAGQLLRVEPYAECRQDLYFAEASRSYFARGYPSVGAVAGTELSRTFGTVRHAIDPELEVRWIPRVFGDSHGAYDEIDRAVSTGELAQAVAHVEQRWWQKQNGAVRELARLDVGQGLDLRAHRMGDAFARGRASVGWLSIDASLRYAPVEGRLDQLAATATFDTGHGFLASARYEEVSTSAQVPGLFDVVSSNRLRAGIDELLSTPSARAPECTLNSPVDSATGLPCVEPAQMAAVTLQYRFSFGLTARYDAYYQARRVYAEITTDDAGHTVTQIIAARPFDRLSQQSLSLAYAPACDCWRVEAHVVMHAPQVARGPVSFDAGFTLTLARFGTLGAGR